MSQSEIREKRDKKLTNLDEDDNFFPKHKLKKASNSTMNP